MRLKCKNFIQTEIVDRNSKEKMAYPRVQTNRGELRIHESLDSLNTDLANYICELSQAAVNERGVFNIVFSRGSYLSILGYVHVSLLHR